MNHAKYLQEALESGHIKQLDNELSVIIRARLSSYGTKESKELIETSTLSGVLSVLRVLQNSFNERSPVVKEE